MSYRRTINLIDDDDDDVYTRVKNYRDKWVVLVAVTKDPITDEGGQRRTMATRLRQQTGMGVFGRET